MSSNPVRSPMDVSMTDNPSDCKSGSASNHSIPDRHQLIDVHVEICVKNKSRLRTKEIKKLYTEFQTKLLRFLPGKLDLPSSLSKHIHYIQICHKHKQAILAENAQIQLHIFRNNEEGMIEEIDDETSVDSVHVANTLTLPNIEFDQLFESLIFEDNLKQRLLNYMRTVSVYGNAKVNKREINWNGVILLHGPPGTGKTSLCKALAQKLSIRLCHQYRHISLIEINAHSLFSKWFSESGKLISKLFAHIKEMIEYSDSLLFVLIDEIESLAIARQNSSNSSEPSDSIRAVNALLTQIDQLSKYTNVLVLTTSNISESIDLAFIDRADIKQYIGNPNEKAAYHILKRCLNELLDKGVVLGEGPLLGYDSVKGRMNERKENELKNNNNNKCVIKKENISVIPFPSPFVRIKTENRANLSGFSPFDMNGHKRSSNIGENERCSLKLLKIAQSLTDFSGRSLRKLPFIASVNQIETDQCSLRHFLNCLEKEGKNEMAQKGKLKSNSEVRK